ncbi:MAG: hypothetical protein K6E63_11660 [Lachnospiraceae bacterium]|nr:hypothetical protein [Lachnospiraceae bacterium]
MFGSCAGFLPLFANEVEGFSAEEHVSPDVSRDRIAGRVKEVFPGAGESQISKLLGSRR